MKTIGNIHHLKLTTVTPVSIGGDQGSLLSPYSDYVVSTNGASLHYIHPDKLEQAVAEKELLDEYVTYIQTGFDNNRSKFDLRQFITGRMKMNLETITRFSVANHGILHEQRIEVKPIVKSAGRAFLPGSSVKGAMRTAMLYDWLVKSKEGEQAMKQYFSNLRHWEKMEDEIQELKNQRGDYSARERMKDLKRKITSIERELFNEDKLFGTLRDDAGQDSRRIRISDSGFASAWEAHCLRRIRLLPMRAQAQPGSDIPILMEALPVGQQFRLDMMIEPPLSHPPLAYLESKETSAILKNLNNFTLDSLAYESYELGEANNRDNEEDIERLKDFYDILQARAESGEVFLRLGFGKTIYDNSLALALYNGGEEQESLEAFKRLRKLVWEKRLFEDDIYPMTRTITSDGMPLGWVKVSAV
ncbi:MAG: type III-A CRISPR-associated RAMP protein Csm5 [Saprospiraceae bacterium]|nr:MAG: type III-A CRISPR-associated RAMP protein Csm5 [Saprospiraceae bacterium]